MEHFPARSTVDFAMSPFYHSFFVEQTAEVTSRKHISTALFIVHLLRQPRMAGAIGTLPPAASGLPPARGGCYNHNSTSEATNSGGVGQLAGHSKWANRVHRKTRQDARRSKIFSKLSRAITVAARNGGGHWFQALP